jgi:hypothetical protein
MDSEGSAHVTNLMMYVTSERKRLRIPEVSASTSETTVNLVVFVWSSHPIVGEENAFTVLVVSGRASLVVWRVLPTGVLQCLGVTIGIHFLTRFSRATLDFVLAAAAFIGSAALNAARISSM